MREPKREPKQDNQMHRSLQFVGVLLAGALLLSGTASAQRGQGPCAEDVKKFCADVKSRGGKIGKCLREHEAELSSACGDKFAKMKEQMASFAEACGEDLKKFCSDVQSGGKRGGGALKCLDENVDSLSPACQESVTAMKEKRQGRGARTQ